MLNMGYRQWIPGILGLSVLLAVPSCSKRGDDRIVLLGSVPGEPTRFYLLEQNTFELQQIDSVAPAPDGTFRIDIPAGQTTIFSLRAAGGEQVVFIASPGDTVRISGQAGMYLSGCRASGNRETELVQTFYDYAAGNLRKVDSLQFLIDRNLGEEGFYELTVRVDSIFSRIWEAQRQYEKNFITEFPGTFAALLVVNYHFGVKPVLSPHEDRYYYNKVDSGLMAAYRNNKHTLFFHRWLKEVR